MVSFGVTFRGKSGVAVERKGGVECSGFGMRTITRAPRSFGGEHSAAKMGVVADLGPMPKPRKKREMNMCHQLLVKACQKQASAEIRHEMKMVPRRPKSLFMGSVSQQPMTAQQR